MAEARKPKSAGQHIYDFLSGYALAVVLLILMLALTYFGTFAQVEHGLYVASNLYFESFIVRDQFMGVPIILPGVYLVSILLFINLLLGAIVRARKSWRKPGMIIAHGGILFILFSGFVAFHFTKEGNMQLYKGARGDEVFNLTNWSVEIAKFDAEGKSEKAFVIEPDDLKALKREGARRVFHGESIPFEIELYGYVENLLNWKLQLVGIDSAKDGESSYAAGPYIDGLALVPQKLNKQAELNLPGTYMIVRDANGKELANTIVVGGNGFVPRPLTVEVDGVRWGIDLTKKRYVLPFGVELEKFEKEDHPGTERAREYSSHVVRVDDGKPTDRYHISMNKPMRYQGFTVYQASWGPQGAPEGTDLYTGLVVAQNPADQWPKWATYVVAIGMTIHFGQKLLAYLRRSSRKAKKKENPDNPETAKS